MPLPPFFRKFDWVLLAIVAAIVLLGAATFYGIGAKSSSFVTRQIIFLAIGIAVMIGVSFF